MNLKTKLLFAPMLLFLSGLACAQTDEGPDPPPPASIDRYLVYLAILGSLLAYYFFKRNSLLNKKTVKP